MPSMSGSSSAVGGTQSTGGNRGGYGVQIKGSGMAMIALVVVVLALLIARRR